MIRGGSPERAHQDQPSAVLKATTRRGTTVTTIQAFEEGRCTGIVKGLLFAAFDVCKPARTTQGQAVRVVVKYIDDRPERLHENFKTLAAEALQAAWPCKK